MVLIKNISEIKDLVSEWKKEGKTIGLVPTMGYLHEGHESLIKKARKENDKVIVSVFVNPTQFGPNEDLESYPRNIEKDRELCESCGVDVVFNPEPVEMYKNNASTYINVQGLTEGLCGASRPIHFRGVCTVVSKLFNITMADRAYFGEKDAQQLAVVKKMVEDLNFNIDVVGCPIIREKDGLAKSSRNTYLSKEERVAALILNKSLNLALKKLKNGEASGENVINVIKGVIKEEPLAKIDYVEVVDSKTLKPVKKIENSILVAIAVYIGKTRLIDNFTFNRE
ncbi:pantoate--beta-alanine ligase [Clostridium ihumii]|uniref:pantoate--beta-alanine ligase n=1 Tax=Clostridium ihumii TaxID=1470356 RepID=UPI0005900A58|nr:pantoate--beta-alanine ligase [Clostridium ihumii]